MCISTAGKQIGIIRIKHLILNLKTQQHYTEKGFKGTGVHGHFLFCKDLKLSLQTL